MKPIRTPSLRHTLKLSGGTDENDLPYTHGDDGEGHHVFLTVWEPTQQERAAILEGANIVLMVWGTGHPPVAMNLTDEQKMP
jgi:hypothetical protein